MMGSGRFPFPFPSFDHALPWVATEFSDQPLAHQHGCADDVVLRSGRQERGNVIEKRGHLELGGQVRFKLRAGNSSIAFFQIAFEARYQLLIIERERREREP